MSSSHEGGDASNVTMPPIGDQGKGTRGRSRSKDLVSSLESRLVRMETAVCDLEARMEDDYTTSDTLKESVESLRNEFQGCLNALVDKLEKKFEAKFDQMTKDITAIRKELEEVRGDWALCKEAVVNKAHVAVARETPRLVDVPKPKSYDGKRDAKELETFLWSIERYLQHLHIEDDASKISTATMYLTDNALLWWRRRSLEIERGTFTLETWVAFKDDIKLHFYPPNARLEAKEKLRWLKHSGTIRDYVTEFSNLLFEVSDMSEEDKFVYFLSGLQPWARTELQRRAVQTVSQAIAAAESLIEIKRSDSNHKGWKGDNITGGGGDKEAEENSNREESTRWKDKHGGKNKSRFYTSSCYFCDGPHLMRDCPKRKTINAMATQWEREENETEEQVATMSSLKLLNAIKVQSEVPKSQSKGLMYVDVSVGGKTSRAMVDTGATHNFVSIKEAKRLGLKASKGGGSVKPVDSPAKPIEGVARVKVQIGSWSGLVEFYIIPMDDYDLVIGADFMDSAKAILIPYTNTMCIADGGSSCAVPIVRLAKMKSKAISALQLIKGIEGGQAAKFVASKEDEATPKTSQDLREVLADSEVVMPKKLSDGVPSRGEVHHAQESRTKPRNANHAERRPSQKEALVANGKHNRQQRSNHGRNISGSTPKSLPNSKAPRDVANSLLGKARGQRKTTRRGRRWNRWGRMSRSAPRPWKFPEYAHFPSSFTRSMSEASRSL